MLRLVCDGALCALSVGVVVRVARGPQHGLAVERSRGTVRAPQRHVVLVVRFLHGHAEEACTLLRKRLSYH